MVAYVHLDLLANREAQTNQSMNQLFGTCPRFPRSPISKVSTWAFIYAVHGRNVRHPPAEADMQRHFQVSPPSVHQMVLTLERAGLIRRTPGVARSNGTSALRANSILEIL